MTSRMECRIREAQKTLRPEVKFTMSRNTTVRPAGNIRRFIQDRPAANKSPISTHQKIQGMSNAMTMVVLIRDHNSIFSKGTDPFSCGVGFIPRMVIWRTVFSPFIDWPLMVFGILLTLSQS